MSIFSSLQPEAHLNHNVFDLSRRSVLSTKVGMGTPVFVQHTVPNGTYDINVVDQVELSGGMQAANFARISQQIEYYFVPYSQLWKHFDSFYYQRVDPVRNFTREERVSVPNHVPYIPFNDLITKLVDMAFCCRILVALRYSKYSVFNNPNISKTVNLQYIDDAAFLDFCRSDSEVFLDVHGRLCIDDILRNFDLLGYCNLTPVVDELERLALYTFTSGDQNFQSFTDYFNAQTGDSNNNIDAPFDDLREIIEPIVDSSHVASFMERVQSLDHLFHTVQGVSPFPILAYLKIFNDNFRNLQYDETNYAYYYNLDFDVTGRAIDIENIIFCLRPWYRLYKRDIFTGTYPNAQFGDVSIAGMSNPVEIQALSSGSSSVNVSSGKLSYGSNTAWNINSGVSALAIRQAEAMQRYKEKNLRAGRSLDAQQKAFFGDKSAYQGDDYSLFLGSVRSDVLINDVTATSESDGVNLGDKGATAHSSIGGDIKRFVSHDFGVIIGIMYFYPETEYEAFGLDPHLSKLEKFDFFNPDFQNLGLAPVINYYYSLYAGSASVLGYSSRYWEYKTAIDKVHGQFYKNGVFNLFVTPRDDADFITSRLSSLYVSPNDVDRIFYTSADNLQSSDQFIVNIYHTVKAILPMSVTGLPY